MSRYTSRIFAVWTALEELLNGLDFPPDVPVVSVGDPGEKRDMVSIVVSTAQDADTRAWVVNNAGYEQHFHVMLDVQNLNPGMTNQTARDQLKGLTETIEAGLRNLTGVTTAAQLTLGVPGVIWVQIADFNALVRPDVEGWVGEARITLAVFARI